MCVCMYLCMCVCVCMYVHGCTVVKSVPRSNNNSEEFCHTYSLSAMSGKDQHLRDLLLDRTSEVQRVKADAEK